MKAIQANPLPVARVFDREFVIPDFQRPYSWGEEECEQLWEDISSFLSDINDSKETYFLGSIVVYPYEENDKVWGVIDGQQRLTTLLMLIRALFAKAGTKTILEKKLYKADPNTGDVIRNAPRLESKVLAGDGQNDYKDFQKIMKLDFSDMPAKNPFRLNYEILRKKLEPWWEEKTPEQRDKAITAFQNNIVMLPIECNSLDDALKLFQIINNRGMRLNDSDIFKADIYGMSPKEHRENFIKRWSDLDDHETLFRIHMHILRAEGDDTGKETALRPYIKKYFARSNAPTKDWDSVVCSLENYHLIHTNRTTWSDESAKDDATIFWKILEQYPNIYWCYPLYVFLLKHGKRENDDFSLAKEKQKEYIELLKNTVRYFYIKGVVYNTANSVKDTTYKACAAIAHDRDYAAEYRKNIDAKKDLDAFDKKLTNTDYGRCEKGLVWLCSSLNSNQNRSEYAKMIEQCQTEHILPWKWNNYDKWCDTSHQRDIGKIGNLIPLEWKLNIQASNEFFKRKQTKYEDSKIQDALDLSKKDPKYWYPEDVKQRQETSLHRLEKFFKAIQA